MLYDKTIRGLKSQFKKNGRFDKTKYYDGLGLYLFPQENGRHRWRFRYRFDGKEQMLSLGTYPDVTLTKAREKRDAARGLIADGINPSQARKDAKLQREREVGGSFRRVSEDWLGRGCPGGKGRISDATIHQLTRRLENYVYPKIGILPITDIKVADFKKVLDPIEAKGRHETAHRVRALCDRIWRYAIFNELAQTNIPALFLDHLMPVSGDGFAWISDPAEFGAFLRACDDYSGYPTTVAAIRIAPLVFLRPGELRAARWDEIRGNEWHIPAERMKERRAHVVPLAKQTKALLDELRPHSERHGLLFPSVRSPRRPISDNTLNASYRRMGYTPEQVTAHGLRKTASTLLNEQGFNREWIEAQLAHKIPGVEAIYNKAIYLDQRRSMMQAWADYCDGLKSAST